jgi:hypothetical protein
MTYFNFKDLQEDVFNFALRKRGTVFLNKCGSDYVSFSMLALYAEYGLDYLKVDYSNINSKQYGELLQREQTTIEHCTSIIMQNPERFIKEDYLSYSDHEFINKLSKLLAKSVPF